MNKKESLVVFGLLIFSLLGAGFMITRNADSNDNQATVVVAKVNNYEISPEKVAEKIKGNDVFTLLDVRTMEEYEEGHIEGTLLLPLQLLNEQALVELGLDDKNKEIVIYCRSGNRSKQAYDLMSSWGYTNIKSLAGGINTFKEYNK